MEAYLSFSMVLFLLANRRVTRVFLLMQATTPTPTKHRKATRMPSVKPPLSAHGQGWEIIRQAIRFYCDRIAGTGCDWRGGWGREMRLHSNPSPFGRLLVFGTERKKLQKYAPKHIKNQHQHATWNITLRDFQCTAQKEHCEKH